ncbi:hypothetical protein GCM10010964_09220 [Caldovatus sediminis]|uniref:CAAX prenyl protease 2/Lysostaphin resistance protein A-like domain-containing protein n=1 Tax=Caldovatus sediminis TaxID=2041189 RepID=A0A8J3ECM0_9PROT|nr:hypothetical protein GCM10010964_09220 [Caldovatus sediminis]
MVANAFAQVLPASVAEVPVCSVLVGGAAGGRCAHAAPALAVLLAAALFGIYHVAHSPSFDQPAMILLLTGGGLATRAFLAVTDDLWGTIALHDWSAMFGVTGALTAADRLGELPVPRWPLFAMALSVLVPLAAGDAVRRRHPAAPQQ